MAPLCLQDRADHAVWQSLSGGARLCPSASLAVLRCPDERMGRPTGGRPRVGAPSGGPNHRRVHLWLEGRSSQATVQEEKGLKLDCAWMCCNFTARDTSNRTPNRSDFARCLS